MSANDVIGIPLFAGHVHDLNFKRVATRGKNQSGIDLIGARDRKTHPLVGRPAIG